MAVKVYSTSTCPWCVKAKNYLKEKNVRFSEHDVNSDSVVLDEMIKRTGQRGVPVLHINGNIVIGFDIEAINDALGD